MNFQTLENKIFLNEPPDTSKLANLKKMMDFKYPTDYFEFLNLHDGGEGELGEDYLMLWCIDEMIEVNRLQMNNDSDFFEKYWIFGSNGGIFYYVFELKTGELLEIDPYDDTYCLKMGKSFFEFITIFSEKTCT